MAQGRRNLLGGVISAIWYTFWSIVIPLLIFEYLNSIGSTLGFQYSQEDFKTFRYWIISFGLISTATVFFKSSSPKYSSRRAVAELFLILVNSFYFYIYVISGITDLAVQIPIEENIIHFSLNLDKMIYVNMGIYALNIFVALYDLILSIVSPVEIKGEYTEKDYDKERTIEKYGRYLDR